MPSVAAPLLFFLFHSPPPDDGALAQMLTQYEMALEMFEQEGVVVLPVLIGSKSPE